MKKTERKTLHSCYGQKRLIIRHEARTAIDEFLDGRSTVKSRTKLAETMSLLISKAWTISSTSEKSEAIVDIAKLLIGCDWQLTRDLTKECVKETVRDVVFEAAVSHYTKPEFFCTKEGTIAAFEAASLIKDAVIQESVRELLFHPLLNQTHLPEREALKFIHALISNTRSVEQKESFCEQLFISKLQTNNYQLALDTIALMKTADRQLGLYSELIPQLLLAKAELLLQKVVEEVQYQFGNEPLYSIVNDIVEKKCSEQFERKEKREQAKMLLKMIDDSGENKNAEITGYVKSLVSQDDLTSAYYLAGEMPTIKEQSECRFTLFHLAMKQNKLPLAEMIARHIPDKVLRKEALQLLREPNNP
jgi:hypothetical protein